MKTMYKTRDTTYNPITSIEVIRETEKTVWYTEEGRLSIDKSLKKGSYASFFDTYKEAKQHLINQSEQRIEQLKESIKNRENSILELQEDIEKFKKL